MIDTTRETLIPLVSAHTYLGTRGIKASKVTVYRWASAVGVHGIRL